MKRDNDKRDPYGEEIIKTKQNKKERKKNRNGEGKKESVAEKN